MTLVVGTDEAGYGPNLGPLVVAATAWEADASTDDVEELFASVTDSIDGLWGDSKRIFRGGDGFPALERGAVAGLLAVGGQPHDWASLLRSVAATEAAPAEWAASAAALPLPHGATIEECVAASARASAACAALGVRLVTVRCRLLQPREFNALLASGLNKSDILSQVTLDLAAALVEESSGGSVVWCDRHGGRRRYAPLVSRAFTAPLVQVLDETPRRSAYRMPAASCRIEFSVGGESRLPVALASMIAKYLREVSMAAFNDWWTARVAGLAPTAGYPVDAARWRRDATDAVRAAGIDWDDLWRRA